MRNYLPFTLTYTDSENDSVQKSVSINVTHWLNCVISVLPNLEFYNLTNVTEMNLFVLNLLIQR